MMKVSKRTRLAYVTVAALSSTFMSSEAWADCISQSPVDNASVICGGPGANGWGPNAPGYGATAVNGLKVTVNAGATVTNSQGGAALINAGTGSSVINFSGSFNNGSASTIGINAGNNSNPAIAVGGGTVITNNSDAYMTGAISFGSATGSTVNVLNNNYAKSGSNNLIGVIDGDVTAAGNLTVNNQGVMGWDYAGLIKQTGAGTVIIKNGVDGGYASSFNGGLFQNGILANYDANGFVIDTQGNTTVTNYGGGNGVGALIGGNVRLGTGGTGASSIVNGKPGSNATILGNVTMSDKDNMITNDGTITGNVTMSGSGANVYNAGSLGSSGDNGVRLPGSAINGSLLPTGVVSGTLQGSTAIGATNTLNLNGTGSSTLQTGSVIKGFDTVNKNDDGTWTIKNTLDGTAGKLTTVNVKAGELVVDKADFLGGSGSTVKLSNDTILQFEGVTAGNFAGNIVDATGASNGWVVVTGANATTLSGTNTYSGDSYVDGGTLNTGSNGALSANSDYTILNNGVLNVNHQNAIKGLYDDSGNPNGKVNIANGASLTLGGGVWGGAAGSEINGTGTLIKVKNADFNLQGTNAVNLAAGGVFKINNGAVNVNATNAIGATTAVEVNSTTNPAAAGILNVNRDLTIGSLAGTGADAQVVLAEDKTLTTGGLNSSTGFAGKISGGGSLFKAGTGTMTLTGQNSYDGGTEVGAGQLRGFAGTTLTNGSLQGNILVDGGATLQFDQTLSPIGNGSGTYAGNITGPGLVMYTGNSSTLLTLTGNNTGHTGQTTFNSGTVAISSANNVGTGLLYLLNGTLRNTASLTLANQITAGAGTVSTDSGTTLTLNGNIGGATGSLTKTGAGTLILGGNNTYGGGTTVSAGTLQGQAGTGLQGAIVNNAAVKFTGTGTYSGAMSGTGTVEIAPTTTTFTGTNKTYSGNTTVDATATLVAGNAGALSANSIHVVNGTLSLTGNNAIKSLGGANGGVVNLNNNTLTFSTEGNQTFAGTINGGGTGALSIGGVVGNTWTMNGTASGLSNFTSGGLVALNGSITATTGVNNGTLSGNGTFTGAFTNNFHIRPGTSPGILHFVGSYTQTSSGIYTIDINANNSSSVTAGVDYDQIQVSGAPGTATLAGSAVINQNGGQFVNGTVYHILTTTSPGGGATDGIINGSLTFTNNNNVISPFITLAPNIANNTTNHTGDYTLTVVRSAYNTVANNPNQAAVAGLTSGQGLQGLVGLASANAAIARIDNMTADQARDFYDQISPEPYAAYVRALQDQGNLFTRQVAHRMAQTTSEADAKMGVWGNLYGQWGNGKNRRFRFGSDQDIKGGALGVDGTMSGNLTLGAAVGYSEAKVDYNLGNSKGKSKSWQVGAYASYHPGNVVADLQVAYVHGKVRAVKGVEVGSGFSATSGAASARTSGNLFKVIGTVGYELGSETLNFRPFVGVDFTTGKLKGFNEHGTLDALLLSVGRQKADRTDLLVGFKFAPKMGSLQPYADATLRYGLKRNSGNVRAFFNDIPADQFTVSGQRSAKMQGELDAGLAYGIGKNASIFFGYEGTLRKSLTEHGVNGGVKFAF